jgi:hypothetical protein
MTAGIKGFQTGDLNPSKSAEWRQKVSQRLKGTTLSTAQRKKISKSLKITLKDPEIREYRRQLKLGKPLSEEIKQKIRETKAKKPRKISTLIKNLDTVYSRYIRTKYAVDGIAPCFTCEKSLPIAEMDCGHFVSRRFKSVRFHEKNTHPQCRYCNRYNEGMKDVYAFRLIEKYGPDIIRELNQLRLQEKRFTRQELEALISHYKQLNENHSR